LILLKGLPLAYNRDLQEDKQIVFGAVDRTIDALKGMSFLLDSLQFDEERLREAAGKSGSWSTDVAEALVIGGVPFRRAHEIVGRLVAELESSGRELAGLSGEDLARIDPALASIDPSLADPAAGVEKRDNPGGTSKARVNEQADALEARVEALDER
jgi:argininosuccinate lyase